MVVACVRSWNLRMAMAPWLLLAHVRRYFLVGQNRQIELQTQRPCPSCYIFDNYLTRGSEVPGPSNRMLRDVNTASLNI